MDPKSLAKALAHPPAGTPKAIIPVHLYGQAADMPAILELARRYKLRVIEDCAQSHGATLDGRMTGTFGDIAAFSFYPTKNLGALGDGGMVVTTDAALAERVRLLRQYGWRTRYVSEIAGGNSRLDELQAAILRVKLGFLKSENVRRNELARLYDGLLKDTGLILPKTRLGAEHVFHQYVVRASQRDALAEHLKQEGIGTIIHYPVPIHLQPAYSGRLSRVVPLLHTEKIAQEVLSLPMYPQLTEEQVGHVCAAIVKFFRK
jgi:dTDP-4-amino-4,6-dideoxygalactose transaminase